MFLYISQNQSPQFNCATEEYFLKYKEQDFFIIYQNIPSIVLGKHQNALAEINYKFCVENNIPFVRRISGGGTVFHDLGNINFSFIKSYKDNYESKANFTFFLKPIIDFFKSKGLNAYQSGRNDIFIDEYKVSGNAQHLHIQNQKTLHHGTLLFSSNLKILSEGLKTSQSKYFDKSVKSVRSKVKNISEFLNKKSSLEEFKNELIQYLTDYFKIHQKYELNDFDKENIEKFSKEKYSTKEWNLNYSPNYQIISESLEMSVNKGIIKSFLPKNEFYQNLKINEVMHDFDSLKETLIKQNYNLTNSQIFKDFF